MHWDRGSQRSYAACQGSHCEYDAQAFPVRTKFPETWIWSNLTTSSSGVATLTMEVPDTITDWVATGFALNRDSGIGVASQPANVTTYLPFFVSLHLPFSIVSQEMAVIQAVVFNYYPHDLYANVKLKTSKDAFTSMEVNKYGEEEEVKEDIEKCILVRSNDASSAYFVIKPQTIGTINLEVEATSNMGRDTVRRSIVVKPPGIEKEENVAALISLKSGAKFEKEIPIMYPPRIVPGSERVQVTVIGDLFGPSLEHLDRLLQIPHGCGEQNMVRFAPAIAAAVYLNATGRYDQKVEKRIQHIMETGYQRQLTYQHPSGGFRAFNHREEMGSLWLTAFVLRSFAQANEFTYIDPAVVERGVRFILNNQRKEGSFNSTGFVHNKAM
ncbi:A2MG-like protein, partial [Mya arenaria]